MDIALLLHWWGWKSNGNWFPWLEKELNKKFLDVYTPNLPHTNHPVLEEQNDYLNVYFSSFKKWGYIISHSLWCQLAMKFIEENNIKDSIIIMVAPAYPWLALEMWNEILWDAYSALDEYYNTEMDFKKINKLNNSFHVFLSDNDPYINMENAKKYFKQIKTVKYREFKNKVDFYEGAWIIELEEILEYIK